MISIIVASYNKANYIEATIQSVIAQSYENWELIVVDDCSTDGTVEKLKAFSANNRIKIVLNDTNNGANFCRNIGLKKAIGNYLIFMDADDLLAPFCLQKRSEFIEKHPSMDFIVTTMAIFNKVVGDSHFLWLPERKDCLNDFLKHDLPWQTMQPTWRKEFVERLGGFDLTFDRLQDVELHTRALFVKGVRYVCVNTAADCYFRIDEERLNFDTERFLDKWITSSIKYYLKFYEFAKAENRSNLLMGTIFKAYLQLLVQFRLKNINKEQFDSLESKLFQSPIFSDYAKSKKVYFYITRWFNLLPFRIKGINWFINKALLFALN